MSPRVSIVVILYNCERYISQVLESILAQTFSDFELVVWDDGSTDDSLAIARRYADQDHRIRLITSEHQGMAPALRQALVAATGEYLAYVNSDDKMDPEALKETVAALDAHPKAAYAYTHYRVMDAMGRIGHIGQRCEIPYSPERLLLDFMTFHFRLVRRTAYEQVGGIDPQFQWAFDYDLCIRLSEVGDVVLVPKVLYYYRIQADLASQSERLRRILYTHEAVLRGMQRRGLLKTHDMRMLLIGRFSIRKRSEGKQLPTEPSLDRLITTLIPNWPFPLRTT